MVPEIGQFALIMALLLALTQATIPLIGAPRGNRSWIAVAAPAGQAQFIFVAIAFCCLAYSFITNDFSVLNVATNSNSQLPLHYRLAATWGSHEGSLLLWALMLGLWTVAVSLFSRHLPDEIVARVLSVMGVISVGFLAVHAADVESICTLDSGRARWTRSESPASGSGDGGAPADALHGLRRFLRRVCVRDFCFD